MADYANFNYDDDDDDDFMDQFLTTQQQAPSSNNSYNNSHNNNNNNHNNYNNNNNNYNNNNNHGSSNFNDQYSNNYNNNNQFSNNNKNNNYNQYSDNNNSNNNNYGSNYDNNYGNNYGSNNNNNNNWGDASNTSNNNNNSNSNSNNNYKNKNNNNNNNNNNNIDEDITFEEWLKKEEEKYDNNHSNNINKSNKQNINPVNDNNNNDDDKEFAKFMQDLQKPDDDDDDIKNQYPEHMPPPKGPSTSTNINNNNNNKAPSSISIKPPSIPNNNSSSKPQKKKKPSAKPIKWRVFLDDKKKWVDYKPNETKQIENAYKSGSSSCAIKLRGQNYEIRFTTMKQVNLSTNYSRKVQRTTGNSASNSNSNLASIFAKLLSIPIPNKNNQNQSSSTGSDNDDYDDNSDNDQPSVPYKPYSSYPSYGGSNKKHIWQWKDDNGWKNYASDISDEIETIFINRGSNGYGKVVVKQFGSQRYEIRPFDSKQFNKATMFSRVIRRVDPQNIPKHASNGVGSYKWQWKDDKGYKDYDNKYQSLIESAYQNGNDYTFTVGVNKKYKISFSDLKQYNMSTNYGRDVRRIVNNGKSAIKKKPKVTAANWKGPKRKTFGDKGGLARDKQIMTLYHVTDKKAAMLIKKSNRMIRGGSGMFGGGIYFAETIASAQYKSEHKGGWVITCKVLVGKPLVAMDGNAGKFDFQSLCGKGFDSVNAPKGGGKGKPERVVYNWDQVFIVSVNPVK